WAGHDAWLRWSGSCQSTAKTSAPQDAWSTGRATLANRGDAAKGSTGCPMELCFVAVIADHRPCAAGRWERTWGTNPSLPCGTCFAVGFGKYYLHPGSARDFDWTDCLVSSNSGAAISSRPAVLA